MAKKSGGGDLLDGVNRGDFDYDYIGSKDESAEARTMSSRARLRQKMQSDVEQFLKRGGTIDVVENTLRQPAKKPKVEYGSEPISAEGGVEGIE